MSHVLSPPLWKYNEVNHLLTYIIAYRYTNSQYKTLILRTRRLGWFLEATPYEHHIHFALGKPLHHPDNNAATIDTQQNHIRADQRSSVGSQRISYTKTNSIWQLTTFHILQMSWTTRDISWLFWERYFRKQYKPTHSRHLVAYTS